MAVIVPTGGLPGHYHIPDCKTGCRGCNAHYSGRPPHPGCGCLLLAVVAVALTGPPLLAVLLGW